MTLNNVAVNPEAPEHEFKDDETIFLAAKAEGRLRAATDSSDAKETRMVGERRQNQVLSKHRDGCCRPN